MGYPRQEYWSGLPFPSPEELQKDENSNQLQYSCLGHPMDKEAWQATAHQESQKVEHDLVSKQQQQLILGEHPVSGSFFSP